MKKGLLLLILPLLTVLSCDKKEVSDIQKKSFIKILSDYPECTAADVKQLKNNGYAVLGTANTLTAGKQICLILTNEFGNTTDSIHYFGGRLDDQAYCLQILPDGGFGILGSSTNPETGKLEVYFIRTDARGIELWNRTISRNEDLEACHFEVTGDGAFVLAGYADTITNNILHKSSWYFAIDENGNNKWPGQRIGKGDKDEECKYLQILQGGDIVLTGRTKNDPSGTPNYRAFIYRTDSIGHVYKSYIFTSSSDEEANCVRVIGDGTFLVTGTTNDNTAGGSDVFMADVAFLSGIVINWKKTYGTTGNDFGIRVLDQTNSFVILSTTAGSGSLTSISLIVTDKTGNNPFFSTFGQGSELSGSALENTSDGGYIVTGTNYQNENNSSITLIKTKPNGSL